MNQSNFNKAKQLGMSYGTACNRLRKALLFKYIKKAKEDICFKCGKPISFLEDLSIEHKIPWQEKDNKFFWDLDNISFSHLKCNTSRKWFDKRPHGNRLRYTVEGCRCNLCRKTALDYQRKYRQRKKKALSSIGKDR